MQTAETLVEYLIYANVLLYSFFDILMVMYFGNEITLSSDRISYCLFESDWVDQLQSTKKYIIIFGEFMQKPHKLVMIKLYSLTLEIFMRVRYSNFYY